MPLRKVNKATHKKKRTIYRKKNKSATSRTRKNKSHKTNKKHKSHKKQFGGNLNYDYIVKANNSNMYKHNENKPIIAEYSSKNNDENANLDYSYDISVFNNNAVDFAEEGIKMNEYVKEYNDKLYNILTFMKNPQYQYDTSKLKGVIPESTLANPPQQKENNRPNVSEYVDSVIEDREKSRAGIVDDTQQNKKSYMGYSNFFGRK